MCYIRFTLNICSFGHQCNTLCVIMCYIRFTLNICSFVHQCNTLCVIMCYIRFTLNICSVFVVCLFFMSTVKIIVPLQLHLACQKLNELQFQMKCWPYVHNTQGVLKRPLQWYSKWYCVASATKTFTLKGVQTILVQGVTFGIPLWTSFINTLR
jgi:hypothetical protein